MDKAILAASGIYLIRRASSSECYVGSAVNINRRWAVHRTQLRNGEHHSVHMQRVHDKHGSDILEFRVLEYVADKELLIAREQVWIDIMKPLYNTASVAGSTLGTKRTEESRIRMAIAQTGRKHTSESLLKMSVSQSGRKHTSESKLKMSAGRKGFKHTNETRAKMSEKWLTRAPCTDATKAALSTVLKGKKRTPAQRIAMSETQRNRARPSEATKAKISVTNTGKKHSIETRKKMSESHFKRAAKRRSESLGLTPV